MTTTNEIIQKLQNSKNTLDAARSAFEANVVDLALRAASLEAANPPPPDVPPPANPGDPPPPPPPVDPPPPIDPPQLDDFGVGQDVELKVYHWKPLVGAQPGLKSGVMLSGIHIRGDGKGGEWDAPELGGAGDGPTWEGILLGTDNGGQPLDDCGIKDSLLSHGDRWGSHNQERQPIRRNVAVSGVTIRDIWDEHGIYWDICGYGHAATAEDLLVPCAIIGDVLVEDVGSQGLQFVQRDDAKHAHRAHDLKQDFTPGGLIFVGNSLFRDVGHTTGHPRPGGRPSFTLTFAPSRNPLELEDVHVDNSLHAFSRGALLMQGYAPGYVAVDNPDATGGYERKASIKGGSFVEGVLEQPIGKFDDMVSLEIVGAHFSAKGGQDYLDFKGSGKFVVSDCTGSTRIRYNGQDVGPVSAGFKSAI
jgi:hypothetical protein